jgi:hypothetical protein
MHLRALYDHKLNKPSVYFNGRSIYIQIKAFIDNSNLAKWAQSKLRIGKRQQFWMFEGARNRNLTKVSKFLSAIATDYW